MTPTLEAVYESGIFRPLEPVELPEGEHVWIVKKQGDVQPVVSLTKEAQSPADIVAEISALAVRHGTEETSSRDHDKVLYGPEGAR
jgi:predicted DNA-binding antitoxin AbrB/MazE fold protein